MKTYAICEKCTGLILICGKDDSTSHASKCCGNIQESECSHFSIEKAMLLQLLGNEISCTSTDNKDVIKKTFLKSSVKKESLATQNKKSCSTRNNVDKRKRISVKDNIGDFMTPSKIVLVDGDLVRRSGRKPKPKRRGSSEIWDDVLLPEKNEIENVKRETDDISIAEPVNEVVEHMLENLVSKENTQDIVVEESNSENMEHFDISNENEMKPSDRCTVTFGKDDISTNDKLNDPVVLNKEKNFEFPEIPKDESIIIQENEQLENSFSDGGYVVKKRIVVKAEAKMTGTEYKKWKEQLEVDYAIYKEIVKDHNGKDNIQYRCPKCTERTFFINKIGMFHRHLNACRPPGDPELKCKEPGCDYVAKDSKRLSEHKRYHNLPYMCEFCSRRFSDKRNMKEHRMTHTGELPHECNLCDYKCRNSRLMKEHYRKHTGKMEKCPDCDFQTPYRGSLTSHIMFKHKEKTKYRCIVEGCTYVTNNKAASQKHISIHLGEKNYQCSICEYKAVSKFTVLNHMRSHTKEKVYFCDQCSYSSSYASSFKHHMMTHLGMKTWQCGCCGYNSNTRAKVLRHLSSRHPEQNRFARLVNLGLKLKLDLKKYTREPAPGTEPQEYVVLDTSGQETADAVDSDVVEVNCDEVDFTSQPLGSQEEVVVMTSDGHQLIIPHSKDMDMMTILQEVAIKQEALNQELNRHQTESNRSQTLVQSTAESYVNGNNSVEVNSSEGNNIIEEQVVYAHETSDIVYEDEAEMTVEEPSKNVTVASQCQEVVESTDITEHIVDVSEYGSQDVYIEVGDTVYVLDSSGPGAAKMIPVSTS